LYFQPAPVCENQGVATRIEIDSDLVNEAQHLGGHRTKKEAVTVALQEYIRHQGQLGILELQGKIDYHPGYDDKKLRCRKPHTSA
jgi:Arc/MetJ family transcription regulator